MQNAKFIHKFIQKGSEYTFVLLHGTGGNEDDLIPLATLINPTYSILTIRGKVIENGMYRFFKRLAEGVFDVESLKEQSEDFRSFILEACTQYNLDLSKTVFLGYSNGANMIAATLFLHPEVINNAVLLRPMLPFDPKPVELKAKEILVISGKTDAIVPEENTAELVHQFKRFEANVVSISLPGGHPLSPDDIDLTKEWLTNLYS